MKVKYAYPNNGYDSDKEQCNKLLDPNKVYTVVTADEGSWHTDYYLKEFPNEAFNSVMFEEVKE